MVVKKRKQTKQTGKVNSQHLLKQTTLQAAGKRATKEQRKSNKRATNEQQKSDERATNKQQNAHCVLNTNNAVGQHFHGSWNTPETIRAAAGAKVPNLVRLSVVDTKLSTRRHQLQLFCFNVHLLVGTQVRAERPATAVEVKDSSLHCPATP